MGNNCQLLQDLRIPAISVGVIRRSSLHLGLDFQRCVSAILIFN